MNPMTDVFSAASELANADLASVATEAVDTNPQSPENLAAEAQAAEPSAPEQAAPEPVTAPTPAEIRREMELKWKGQSVRLPEDEVVSLAQKGYDYSQKTAELAREREMIVSQRAQLDQQAAELRQVLSDPQQLRQLVQWAAEQQPDALDPNLAVTAQQAQQMIQQNLGQMQRQVQSEIKRAQLELETNRLEQEFSGSINQHLKQTLDKYPVLQDVEGMESLLRREALAYQQTKLAANPGTEVTLPEVLDVMARAAQRQAQKIESRFQNMLKANAVRQSTVVRNGIDAGGSAPAPVPAPSFKLFSKELRQLAMQDVAASASR
jgi:hypothetical protein